MMKSLSKNAGLILILSLVLVLVIGGAYFIMRVLFIPSAPNGPNIQKIVNAKKIIIGTDAVYPPMEFIDDEGKIVGLGIDIGYAIAKKLGVEAEIRSIAWDQIFEAVDSGEVDIAISSVTITHERLTKYAFSNPYFASGQVIVVANNSSISKPSDLSGKKVTAYMDTTSYMEAVKYVGDSSLVYAYEAEVDESVERLLKGEIEAIVIDYPPGADITKTYPGTKLVGSPFTTEFYGVVTRKGNDDLVKLVNAVIAELKRSGELKRIENKWL